MKLLVIEDEKKTADYLQKGLTESGFVVDVADRGENGLHLARHYKYNLVILDVMLPDMDGWSVFAELQQMKMPVLFLTALDSVHYRVKGLELGAADYVVKPFAFSELLARVRAIIRRGSSRQTETFKIGNLEMDFLRHKITMSGENIDLTTKEFLLLALFARHSGEVLTRTFIAEQVWDMNFDSETNVVDVAIRRLRMKIEEPFGIKFIHTVRGMGYVLEIR